jgi:hypothetical protein
MPGRWDHGVTDNTVQARQILNEAAAGKKKSCYPVFDAPGSSRLELLNKT